MKTRIGDLKFERGFPTEETKHKVFDEIDYQRAVQAYLWAYPAVSFESIRVAAKAAGMDLNVIGIADKYADAGGLWLTANDTTVYAFTNVDLGKHGPVVVDVPPGAIVGLIDDFWQRSIADLGLPGPDGDKGGKFLLVPPGYKGEVPQSGYHVLKGTMNNYNVMVRGILVNNDLSGTVERVKKLRIYPWSEARQSQGEQVRFNFGHDHRHAAAARHGLLGAALGVHQQQPGSGARPLLHGHVEAFGDREGQAVQARRAPASNPRGRGADRRCNGSRDAL